MYEALEFRETYPVRMVITSSNLLYWEKFNSFSRIGFHLIKGVFCSFHFNELTCLETHFSGP